MPRQQFLWAAVLSLALPVIAVPTAQRTHEKSTETPRGWGEVAGDAKVAAKAALQEAVKTCIQPHMGESIKQLVCDSGFTMIGNYMAGNNLMDGVAGNVAGAAGVFKNCLLQMAVAKAPGVAASVIPGANIDMVNAAGDLGAAYLAGGRVNYGTVSKGALAAGTSVLQKTGNPNAAAHLGAVGGVGVALANGQRPDYQGAAKVVLTHVDPALITQGKAQIVTGATGVLGGTAGSVLGTALDETHQQVVKGDRPINLAVIAAKSAGTVVHPRIESAAKAALGDQAGTMASAIIKDGMQGYIENKPVIEALKSATLYQVSAATEAKLRDILKGVLGDANAVVAARYLTEAVQAYQQGRTPNLASLKDVTRILKANPALQAQLEATLKASLGDAPGALIYSIVKQSFLQDSPVPISQAVAGAAANARLEDTLKLALGEKSGTSAAIALKQVQALPPGTTVSTVGLTGFRKPLPQATGTPVPSKSKVDMMGVDRRKRATSTTTTTTDQAVQTPPAAQGWGGYLTGAASNAYGYVASSAADVATSVGKTAAMNLIMGKGALEEINILDAFRSKVCTGAFSVGGQAVKTVVDYTGANNLFSWMKDYVAAAPPTPAVVNPQY